MNTKGRYYDADYSNSEDCACSSGNSKFRALGSERKILELGLMIWGLSPKERLRPQKGISEMRELEIYYEDLNEDTQKTLLEFYKIERPEDGNFDRFPICLLETEDWDTPERGML